MLELWDQSPFVSINVGLAKAFVFQSANKVTQSPKVEAAPKHTRARAPRSSSSPRNYLNLLPLDVDVIVNRCVCRKGIEVRLTPLVLPVLSQLQDDCEKFVCS